MPIMQLTATQLQEKLLEKEDLFLLDVREKNEFDYARIEGSQLIPLSMIPLKINELDSSQQTVLICHHGARSMQAAVYLESRGFNRLYNLFGGIDSWSVHCDSSVPRY